jgi:hypothetical protein
MIPGQFSVSTLFILSKFHPHDKEERMRYSLVLRTMGLAAFCTSGLAQSSSQSVRPNSAIHSTWNRVQQLPAQTEINVNADRKNVTCRIDAVTDDKLTCSSTKGHGGGSYEFSRREIKRVQLSRRGKSGMVGVAVGAGVGAGAGAGIGAGINSGDTASYGHVSGGKSAAVGAGIGAIVGALAGGAIGHSKDTFAPTIYRR